ncbi:MAG: DNA repair exonuclease [Vallitaleaceae bacterium]|nr:DNA repair exonuclease [Vallitaleaceae bacterium]
MSVRFVHTADVHIGTSFASASFGHALGLRRRAEIKETFFTVLDLCVEKNVDLLLIAGDLFVDDFMDMSELKDVQKMFANMENVQIVICAGNHDAIINSGSSFNMVTWSSNVHIFGESMSKISLDALNVDIYGFSWNKKEIKSMSFEALTIEDPMRTNLLMLHGDIYTESQYLPLNVYEFIEKGFDYIALGHIHKPDYDNDFWAYPGSLEPLDFKETGEHGIIEGIIEGKQVIKRFNPMAKRAFEIRRMTIHPDMAFEEIKGMALSEIHKNINKKGLYRLIIEGIKDEDVIINKTILKEILETQVFYCEILDQTQSNYNLESIKENNHGNLIGDFVKYMEDRGLEDPQIKDALYEGLNILLSEKVNG